MALNFKKNPKQWVLVLFSFLFFLFFFFAKMTLKMGRGFVAPAADPCPNLILGGRAPQTKIVYDLCAILRLLTQHFF